MGDVELARIATAQLSLVTYGQARTHLSRKQVEHRLAEGRLSVVRRGVYRSAGATPNPREALLAACLAAGPAAVASYRSAAEIWAMSGIVVEVPEVTVPWPVSARLAGVRGRQSTCLPPEHRTTRDSVPVTTPARTLVDLASASSTPLLGRLVDDSLRRHLTSLNELRIVHERLSESGRRGLKRMAEVLDARPAEYHPGDSDPEIRLVRILVGAGLPRPVQQHQVPVGGTVYLLDLAYPELRIGIEYDGWSAHGATRSSLDRDRARTNALVLAGWTVLHFTSASSAAEVIAAVRAALAAASAASAATPNSSRSSPPYVRDNCG